MIFWAYGYSEAMWQHSVCTGLFLRGNNYRDNNSQNDLLRHETLDSFMDVVRTTGIYLAPYTKSSKLWYPVDEPYRKSLQISSVEDGIELTLCSSSRNVR